MRLRPSRVSPRPSAGETEAAAAEAGAAGGAGAEEGRDGVFKVRLANFEGPFDLLLQLISKHKLDVTEVALSKVTDEFMAHIRAMGPDWDLDQTTEFLVVAATLLDLKAARLLPAAEVEDEADLALLEARDLLFARLLQYRAYKQIADIFNQRLDEEARRYPRTVGLEPGHAELLPEVVISIGPEGFAKLAVKAMQPKPKPQVYVDHIHAPLVSVQEQAQVVVARLRELGEASFRVLVEDTDDTLTVVARFLALLELYREKAVALDQEAALGELTVRWTGGGHGRGAEGHGRVRPAARAAQGGEEGMSEETAEVPAGLRSVAGLDLKPALEAMLMVVDEPATEGHLAKILERPERQIADALRELADEYTVQRRGFELRFVAGGWRFYTRAAYAPAVERLVLDGQTARLTQAALETLAVVAYRQPVSRSRVSAVRGVNCDGVMRTLLQRGLVEEAGTEPETGAILYRTTNYFLERMGLRGLDEPPELAPFLPEAGGDRGRDPGGGPVVRPGRARRARRSGRRRLRRKP